MFRSDIIMFVMVCVLIGWWNIIMFSISLSIGISVLIMFMLVVFVLCVV